MRYVVCIAVLSALVFPVVALADTVTFSDGKVMTDCYVRDEGTQYTVWESLKDVGNPPKIYPRSQIKSVKVERGEDWDVQPSLPDLSVTFIEMNPKLAGLHGRVDYDQYGRPTIGKAPALIDIGDRKYSEPEEMVKNLKLKYKPGEEITLTAHVKNLGFATAKPFTYSWLIDDKEVAKGTFSKNLAEMQEATFAYKYKWQDGFHYVTFKVTTPDKEIAAINNSAKDPLWAWAFTYVVTKGRVDAWHKTRTAYGNFSFEDFYRWHLDIMNQLFSQSIFPSSPDGIKARVRLDRIVYADDIEKEINGLFQKDGIRYDQGGWNWVDDQDKNKKWDPPSKEWRNQTEWSLPHELGHQLGLVDHYNIDFSGFEEHKWADNGEKVNHFQNHPITMMHWHGPQIFNEIDAGYFNYTLDKPRGYFGDLYFNVPANNYLRILDINGNALTGAKVECFQRGIRIDETKPQQLEGGVTYYFPIEDGDFGNYNGKLPVIVGQTNMNGVMRLPNRPVMPVKTFNGYERKPNPFGNMNVVGERCLMMVKVTKENNTAYFWVELSDLCVAWYRGNKDEFTMTLKTPFGSIDSPLPPINLKAEKIDAARVKLTWEAPKVTLEQNYLKRVIGYRVYRRVTDGGLNDRPWLPIGTVNPQTHEFIVDTALTKLDENYWFTQTDRYAITTVGELDIESELSNTALPK